MIRRQIFNLLAWTRARLSRDGAAVRVFEPVMRAATVERGQNRPTWSFIRRNGLTIGFGAFEGMRYPRSVAAQIPGLAGRIGGSYEAELRPAIEKLVDREPQLIVNIGAGDGFYAVGMALRCPQARVIAFELDSYAAGVCADVAQANGVGERVDLRGTCTPQLLAGVEPLGRTVVICDCEGAEAELIDLERIPWLASVPLLIEVHESFAPGLGASLRERLAATHAIEEIEPARRYLEDFPMFWGVPGISLSQSESLMSELRPWRTPWLFAMPR